MIMKTEQLIPAEELCLKHSVEFSFIRSLQESGLIEIIVEQQVSYIPLNQLKSLEQFIRLHYDLDINIEGLEAVSNLLQKMNRMQQEITALRNRLRMYEE